jgi:hypothetical protein
MSNGKKPITKERRLQAFALFTMARMTYAKAREFEASLGELLGYPEEELNYLGCISDQIQEGGKFDLGLKQEGFLVVPDKSKRK